MFNCEYNRHDGRLVTGGVKHIKFWVMEGGYLVGKRGVYGRMGAVRPSCPSRFTPRLDADRNAGWDHLPVGGRRRAVHPKV